GIISGGFGLTKTSAGILVLSNSNSYTGATTISAGTLTVSGTLADTTAVTVSSGTTYNVNADDTIGSLAGAGTVSTSTVGAKILTSGGDNTSTTFSGVIQNGTGTLSLTKSGSGTLTLSGANTYTGLTTVSAGTLAYGVNNAIYTGAVTVNGSTAVLDLGVYTDTVGAVTLTAGQITGTGSSTQGILTSSSGFTINPATGVTVSVSANLAGAVNLIHSGAGTANLSGYNAYSGTTTLNTSGGILAITGSGTLSGTSSGVYSGAISIGTGTTFTYSSSADQTLSGIISSSGTLTKDTSSSSTLTLTNTNTYTGGTNVNAGTLILDQSSNTTGTVLADTGAVTVNGGTLQLNDLTETVGAVTLTSGSITVVTAGNTLTGTSYTLNPSSGTHSISAVLAGSVALTKSGNGTVTLSGTNTYTGVTTINAGTLSVATIGNGGVAGNLGQATNSATNIVLGGGTLKYTGSTASTNRAFTISDSTTGTFEVSTAATDLTISGAAASTSGALTKTGSGRLILSGANQYTGVTTISEGVLQASNASALGTAASGTTVANGAALEITTTINAEALTLNGSGISSGGALRNVSGNNTYAGAITQASDSRINSDSGILTLNVATGNAIAGTFNITFGGSGDITVADPIAISTGTLTKDGSGTLTFTAANTYTGLTTISAGTLAYGVSNAISSGGITINGTGAVLALGIYSDTVGTITLTEGSITSTTGVLTGTSYVLNPATGKTVNVSAILAGSATVTKSDLGTAVLSGNNTYTGLTTISAGVLRVSHNNALGDTLNGTTVSNGAALELTYSTGSGITIGDEALTLNGTGVSNDGALRNISGYNTYGGLITLSTNAVRVNVDSGYLVLNKSTTTISATNINLTFGGNGSYTYVSLH
ncbi:MAG: hypothetical protein EBV74_02310, partial [Alphaproteobacteria bacterium]|nr:hypothetical protein [Candidatus Fonsibacter sp. PEL55]